MVHLKASYDIKGPGKPCVFQILPNQGLNTENPRLAPESIKKQHLFIKHLLLSRNLVGKREVLIITSPGSLCLVESTNEQTKTITQVKP
jgi:hypothetical protein